MQFRTQVPKLLAFAVTMALASGALADEHRHFPMVVHSVGHPVDSRGVVWGHGDIHHFHDFDYSAWRGGYWRHDWHNNHYGWWWIVGGVWVFYSLPIYPYPDPYVPSTVIVQQSDPVDSGVPPEGSSAAPAFWYYCASAKNYYPYVTQCPVGWEQVAATPAAPVQAAPPPPPAGNPPAPPPAGSAPPPPSSPPADDNGTW